MVFYSVIHSFRLIVVSTVKLVAYLAATNARLVICLIPTISIICFAIGVSNNFFMETNPTKLWTPPESKLLQHGKWLEQHFSVQKKPLIHIIIHGGGQNILGKESIDYAFRAVDEVRSAEGFNTTQFSINGVLNFFNDDYGLFQKIRNDDDAIRAVSILPYLPNGRLVNRKDIFGYPSEDEKGILQSAKSYSIKIDLPFSSDSIAFENKAVEILLKFKRDTHTTPYTLEFISVNSYDNEFRRSIDKDKKLLPLVFLAMCLFSSSVYYRRDKVRSSCLLLGLGAIVTCFCSLLMSFGLMFIVQIPFTNLSFMLPFIIVGIGIDDAFIITGSYNRTDTSVSSVRRILIAMEDCGLSIFVTTVTTSLAFGLCLTSQIPAVKDFSIYASLSVFLDFIYQITLFIALIKVNDQRIENRRYDFVPCCTQTARNNDVEDDESMDRRSEDTLNVMKSYGQKILALPRPLKMAIIFAFLALSSFSGYLASKLDISFDFVELAPSDSHVKSFSSALQNYFDSGPYSCIVIFRDLDFSKTKNREYMAQYVNELMKLSFVSNDQPKRFWLDDFESFLEENNLEKMMFKEQLDQFLQHDLYSRLYSNLILRSPSEGNLVASAHYLQLDIGFSSTREQVDFLASQNRITEKQVANMGHGSNGLKFFTFDPSYYMWEFFSITIRELILNTIFGLIAVFVVALIFCQHISGCLLVTSTVALIYLDVLGIMMLSGMAINPVTYISVVLSIGLMVDYVVHIMFRFFESDAATREGKVLDCLTTMGSSILLGGISTVLGIVPLAFSTSEIFLSVFVIFMSIVVLSLVHSVLYVPLLLLICGPRENQEEEGSNNRNGNNDQEIMTTGTTRARERKGTGQTIELAVSDGDENYE